MIFREKFFASMVDFLLKDAIFITRLGQYEKE